MNAILIIILCLSLALNVYLVLTRPKTVEISDTIPEKNSPKNNWLQLQNEGKKYLKEKDGKVFLKVVK